MEVFSRSSNFLDTIQTETNKVTDEARHFCSGLSENQLNWKPAPDRWSIAECLDHLSKSTQAFASYFSNAIGRARGRGSITDPVQYQPTWMGRWVIKQLLPENPRKLPAPKIFRPTESNIKNSLQTFLAVHDEFLRSVRNATGLDYNKSRIRSPVTPFVRYSLADAFVVVVVHAQRHLAQARRVRDTVGFPAN